MPQKNQTIARPNHSTKTFTIRKYCGSKCYLKYKTEKFNLHNFNEAKKWTPEDWEEFLSKNQNLLTEK